MSTPESPSTSIGNDHVTPRSHAGNAEPEEQHQNDSASSFSPGDSTGIQDEINWHYLSFKTDLPSPASLARQPNATSDTRTPPPECPNLIKYISPFQWSEKRKTFITWVSCAATVIAAYTAGSYPPAMDQFVNEWHVSTVAVSVGITTFTAGFAVAPMFLAPFSEINGRQPVFLVTGSLFVLFQLTCALTPTYSGMLVARFLSGCMSSTFSTMVGGVVADIYEARDRNAAMALFSGAALFGTGLGPLVSGFVAQNLNWRWIFYIQVITSGVLIIVIAICFQETRGSVLLSRKAKTLNKWYEQLEAEGYYGVLMSIDSKDETRKAPQRIRWKVKSDEERASIGTMIVTSLYRPFHLLFTEPVVFWFSLWISFSWGVLYLLLIAIPLVFDTIYGFDTERSNALFAGVSISAAIITAISIMQDRLARLNRLPQSQARSFTTSPRTQDSFWRRFRSGTRSPTRPLHPEDLPRLQGFLDDNAGLGGRIVKPGNDQKLRCTEFDENGNVTLVNGEFRKSELIAKYGLLPRDLRKIDSSVLPHILVRPSAILINLLHLRCLIKHNRVLIFDVYGSTDSYAQSLFMYGLEGKLRQKQISTPGAMAAQANLSYEFRALEAVLISVTSGLESEFEGVREPVVRVLRELEEDIDRDKLRHLLIYSKKLGTFEQKARLVRDAIDDLLEADDDLAAMYLTEKAEGHERDEDNHEEVELLLESYYKVTHEIVQISSNLVSAIRNTEEIMRAILDANRNSLMLLELKFSIGTLGISLGMFIAALYGMNLENFIEETNYGFFGISALSSLVAIIGCAWGLRRLRAVQRLRMWGEGSSSSRNLVGQGRGGRGSWREIDSPHDGIGRSHNLGETVAGIKQADRLRGWTASHKTTGSS
ncbi:Hypothetical protein R9X50_00146400 [Acrodontium crateriforme]|uniref:Mitochondrial inner membrane magnesium transporter MRS2 n=1 Tax=Acrodontium crateriforme TaxID=150365 RepID=A0AAQ3M0H0_9PEZI|nr:Hypothetical protein R9X50_00146400 [Acrodontium crateriforme]